MKNKIIFVIAGVIILALLLVLSSLKKEELTQVDLYCDTGKVVASFHNNSVDLLFEDGRVISLQKVALGRYVDGSFSLQMEEEGWSYIEEDGDVIHICSTLYNEINTGVANPASVYCSENGGVSEIREGEDGGQIGYCILPDGLECEEWAFFRGECALCEDLCGDGVCQEVVCSAIGCPCPEDEISCPQDCAI